MDDDEQNQPRHSPLIASSSGVASDSQVQEEEEEEEEEEGEEEGEGEEDGGVYRRSPVLERQENGVSHMVNDGAHDDESRAIRDDTWTCIVVVLTFWFFVSMTLILGVYGPVNVSLGPDSSLLLHPNPLFVQSIKVEELDDSKAGLMLYGFYERPSLDVVTTWTETHSASVPAYSHLEWIYYLNKGTHVNISYSMNSSVSSSVYLVIAQGSEGFAQWLEDPSYPNTTMSWNIIHGNGLIKEEISVSSSYYIALSNMNYEDVEVELNLSVRSLLYNTTEAYYSCSLTHGICSLKLHFPRGNLAVLTSPGPEKGTPNDEWYVKLSYRPRWITYLAGVGGFTLLMLLSFKFLNKFQSNRGNRTGVGFRELGSASTPLLSQKDDDLLSWGSSYDSLSHDEDDTEDWLAVGAIEGKPSKDGENHTVTRRLCAICFDAPRDCFFLPCGHCVACFTCGSRIAEAAGVCPVCSRNMRKVRRIFTV